VKRLVRTTAIALAVVLALGASWMTMEHFSLLREGDVAPDFQVRLSTGQDFRLSDFRGKTCVVLSFYPKDFTAGCTSQACSYRDNFSRVRDLGALIVGISYDGDSTHKEFSRMYNLPYPLISDQDRSISRLYGAARFGGSFLPLRRVTFVIDKKGIIRKVAHHELAVAKHIDAIIECLQGLVRGEEKRG
jgi:peroxiredoxin Q/BCP